MIHLCRDKGGNFDVIIHTAAISDVCRGLGGVNKVRGG